MIGQTVMIICYRDGQWVDYCPALVFSSQTTTIESTPATVITATGVRPDGATFARSGLLPARSVSLPRDGSFAWRSLTE